MKRVNGWWVPSSDTYFTDKVLKAEGFEISHLESALKYVKKFRLAVDAGSHIGTWARVLAAQFDCVVAIEPDAKNYSCLLRNTDHLPNIYPYKFALSNVDGEEVAMMQSTIRPGNSGSLFVIEGRGIPTRTLDSMILSAVSFIKIDVEGHELPVVEGGKETILRCHPVILIEEKNFKDRRGRLEIDYRAAGQLLETWGMRCVQQIARDKIYVWE